MRASGRIEILSGREHSLPEVRVADGVRHHQIDRSSEECFQIFLQREVRIKRVVDIGIEFDEEVNVARRFKLSRDRRTEDLKPADIVGTRDTRDLIPSTTMLSGMASA